MFPPETRKWVLASLNKKWRDFKSDLKAGHYDLGKRKEEIIRNVPKDVLEEQWPILVNGWYTEASQV